MEPLDFKIISSGSKGNAVRIENIMIDCGIPFGRMKEELYKCDTLLITHEHKDHITKKTFNSILKNFPRITTYSNPTVAYSYPMNHVISSQPFELSNGMIITPYAGEHDTEVSYFMIKFGELDIIYATDTCKLENPNEIKFDYLFIESNYDEKKLLQVAGKCGKGYDPYISNQRHLSTQQCKAFYYMWRKSKESELIELHKSTRFY